MFISPTGHWYFLPQSLTNTQPFQFMCLSLVFFSHCKFGSALVEVGSIAETIDLDPNLCSHSHTGARPPQSPRWGPHCREAHAGSSSLCPKLLASAVGGMCPPASRACSRLWSWICENWYCLDPGHHVLTATNQQLSGPGMWQPLSLQSEYLPVHSSHYSPGS